MALDIPTMMVMIAVAAIITAGALLVVRRLHLGIDGVNWWAAANVCAAAGFVIGTMRGVLPEFFTVVVFNSLLVAAASLSLTGCRRFTGRSGWAAVTPMAVTAVAVSLSWFAFVHPSVPIRVQIVSFAVGALIVLSGWTLVRERGSPARHLTGVLYLLHGLFYLVRGVMAIGADIQDFMKPGAMTEAVFLMTFAFLLSAILGQVVMTAERLQEELRRQADCDWLTGALNRRAFRLLAARETARVRRDGGTVSVLTMDLDHFKRLNDHHGHAGGDAMLKSFVATASSCLRAQDVFCRHGGEEFVALLPDTGVEGAQAVAERLRQAFAAARVEVGGNPVGGTVSIGIAEAQGAAADVDDLLRRSDEALYRAKAEGRDRVVAA